MKKSVKVIITLFTTVLWLMGCTNNQETVIDRNKVQIVTSMFPMYEITKEVAGDRAEISVMVGSNEDAHHYEPSAQAVASVNEADIFIYSSDEMEFWVESLLAVVENEDLQVIELSEGIDFTFGADSNHEDEDNHEDHNHGNIDPHFWLNPVAVENQLDLIVEALMNQDPNGREAYEKLADNFSKELQRVDQAYQETFAGVTDRSFVVQHQAFGHLAYQYDLNQVAVGGLTTEVEPNPKQLVDIVEFIKTQEVPVIYYQSGENSAIAETIASETGTEIGVLYDLESPPVHLPASEQLYIDLMYENLEQLKISIHE